MELRQIFESKEVHQDGGGKALVGNWKLRIEVLPEDKNILGCLMKAIDEKEYLRDLTTDSANVIVEK